ncbi:short-chain dehydrogenase, partial [Streptomyces sp. PRKS01-29]|nr:short-chain dehydrogenase [Streptomyces sabulosicollis]
VLDPSVTGGELWAPRRFGLRGAPRRRPVRGHLADADVAAHLWSASRDLTGLEPRFGPA